MTEFLLYSQVNIICIAVLAIIAFNIRTSEFNLGRRLRTLLKLLFCNMGAYLFDIICGYARFKMYPPPNAIYISYAIYFLLHVISAYIWFFYAELLHDKSFFDNKKKHIIIAIPIFLLVILFVVLCCSNHLFGVEDDYRKSAFYILQAAVALGYIFVACIRSLFFARRHINDSNYRDLIYFSFYSLVILICGILQYIFTDFPCMVAGSTISILVLYLHYLRDMISLDPLTQIANRRKIVHSVCETIKILKPNEELYFMFIDVDNFKQINDKHGHGEGDLILRELSLVLKRFSKANNCLCGRYGGDEFAIIQILKKGTKFNSPDMIYKMIEKRNILIKDSDKLSVSIGCAKLRPNEDSIADLVSRADKDMYKIKKSKEIWSK